MILILFMRAKKKKTRAYSNAKRQLQSELNQRHIIETMIEILVEREGGEVTFDEIAERAKISARSIFRFFVDKETLNKALENYLSQYLAASQEQLQALDVARFGKHLFEVFDRHEKLVLAYLYSSIGESARRILRKQLAQMIVEKIYSEKPVKREKVTAKRVALIATLINSRIWHDIRSDFKFSGGDMGEAIVWALRTLIDNLDAPRDHSSKSAV